MKIENSAGIFFYKDEECTVLHRENGPAFIGINGTIMYFIDGIRHRDNGPAIVYYYVGPDNVNEVSSKHYYQNGKLHREDGPAIEYEDGFGPSRWYKHGKMHNENGPAVVWPSGKTENWIDGIKVD